MLHHTHLLRHRAPQVGLRPHRRRCGVFHSPVDGREVHWVFWGKGELSPADEEAQPGLVSRKHLSRLKMGRGWSAGTRWDRGTGSWLAYGQDSALCPCRGHQADAVSSLRGLMPWAHAWVPAPPDIVLTHSHWKKEEEKNTSTPDLEVACSSCIVPPAPSTNEL